MKHFILLFWLLVSLQTFGQTTTDTLVHINVNKNFNYTCTDCPDSVLVVIDSLFTTVYDTITTGGSSAYPVVEVSTATYSVTDVSYYIYTGAVQSVFTLPTGTTTLTGRSFLFLNSGTDQVTFENDVGSDLIIIDPGMMYSFIWNNTNWKFY